MVTHSSKCWYSWLVWAKLDFLTSTIHLLTFVSCPASMVVSASGEGGRCRSLGSFAHWCRLASGRHSCLFQPGKKQPECFHLTLPHTGDLSYRAHTLTRCARDPLVCWFDTISLFLWCCCLSWAEAPLSLIWKYTKEQAAIKVERLCFPCYLQFKQLPVNWLLSAFCHCYWHDNCSVLL